MKRKNFFTSLLMGLGVLVGLGSCDSNNVPRDNQQTDVVNRSTIRSANVNNNGCIVLSSSYEDKSSEYYMALIPKDCKFEIFKEYDRGSQDKNFYDYVLKNDPNPNTYPNNGGGIIIGNDNNYNNDTYRFRSIEIQKYDLDVKNKNIGEDYFSTNISYESYKKYFWSSYPGSSYGNEAIPSNPNPKYYASIVCPKDKYKIIGVTINEKSISLSNVKWLDLVRETYVYNKSNNTYKSYNSDYVSKDIYYVEVNPNDEVSFLLGDKKTGKYVGESYRFTAKITQGYGIANILVNGNSVLKLKNYTPLNGLTDYNVRYLPKSSDVKVEGEPFKGFDFPRMYAVSRFIKLLDSNTSFVYSGDEDVNAEIIFPKKKYIDIVVTKPENGDIKCTVGDKVYVNESFKVEEGSNTPIKLEAIYNSKDYRFNGFSINDDTPQKANPYDIYLNNYKGKTEISIKAVIDPVPAMKYGVSLSSVKGGVARLSEEGLLDKDSEVEVYSEPDEGYELDKILVNGRVIDGTSFKVNSNSKVQVLFKKVK